MKDFNEMNVSKDKLLEFGRSFNEVIEAAYNSAMKHEKKEAFEDAFTEVGIKDILSTVRDSDIDNMQFFHFCALMSQIMVDSLVEDEHGSPKVDLDRLKEGGMTKERYFSDNAEKADGKNPLYDTIAYSILHGIFLAWSGMGRDDLKKCLEERVREAGESYDVMMKTGKKPCPLTTDTFNKVMDVLNDIQKDNTTKKENKQKCDCSDCMRQSLFSLSKDED